MTDTRRMAFLYDLNNFGPGDERLNAANDPRRAAAVPSANAADLPAA